MKLNTFLLYLFIFGFGIENASFGVGEVQSLSLALLLSPLVVVLNWDDLSFRNNIVLFGLLLLSYGTALYFCFYWNSNTLMPFLRQFLALMAGGSFFLATKITRKRLDLTQLSRAILVTSIPFLIIGIFQKLRFFSSPFEARVTSLFTEPSHYGDYLTLFVGPFLLYEITCLRLRKENWRYFLGACSILWVLNFIFVQSGTAVLKIIFFVFLIFVYYKNFLKQKLLLLAMISGMATISLFVENSYIRNLVNLGIDTVLNPEKFLHQHTFYDRFYPLYGVVKHLVSEFNPFGFGLGSDFFEWRDIFLREQHKNMLDMKPFGSFINANFPKVILYFGLVGVAWITYLFRRAIQAKSPFLKVSFLNVLFACFWGVASFAQPYLWFWLALIDTKNEKDF